MFNHRGNIIYCGKIQLVLIIFKMFYKTLELSVQNLKLLMGSTVEVSALLKRTGVWKKYI